MSYNTWSEFFGVTDERFASFALPAILTEAAASSSVSLADWSALREWVEGYQGQRNIGRHLLPKLLGAFKAAVEEVLDDFGGARARLTEKRERLAASGESEEVIARKTKADEAFLVSKDEELREVIVESGFGSDAKEFFDMALEFRELDKKEEREARELAEAEAREARERAEAEEREAQERVEAEVESVHAEADKATDEPIEVEPVVPVRSGEFAEFGVACVGADMLFSVAVAKRRRRDSSSEVEPAAKKPRSIPARPSNTQTAPVDDLEHDAELLAGGHELGNPKKCAWMERGEKCVRCAKKGLRCLWPVFPEEKRLPSKRPLSRCWECAHSPAKERCYTEAHDALLEAWKAEYGGSKKRSAKSKGVAQSRETVSDSDDEDFEAEELPFDGNETTQNWGKSPGSMYLAGTDFVCRSDRLDHRYRRVSHGYPDRRDLLGRTSHPQEVGRAAQHQGHGERERVGLGAEEGAKACRRAVGGRGGGKGQGAKESREGDRGCGSKSPSRRVSVDRFRSSLLARRLSRLARSMSHRMYQWFVNCLLIEAGKD